MAAAPVFRTPRAVATPFFGNSAGFLNTTSFGNAFFGNGSGQGNTTGSNNAFFGRDAGLSNSDENNNTFIGSLSNGAAGITNATALGNRAQVTQSNSLVLGSINGINGATADTNVGIGDQRTCYPSARPTLRRHGQSTRRRGWSLGSTASADLEARRSSTVCARGHRAEH